MEAGAMYRIRKAAGTEAVYNSLEEFTSAVRRGEVHPEDEIFHTRANRWLDVKSHPHYRTAIAPHGHESGQAAPAPVQSAPAAPAPRSPAPPRPASIPAPGSSPSSRAQVFERPVVRPTPPPQTTVRAQLQAAPGPKAEAPVAVTTKPEPPAQPRYGPPQKSNEITYLDLSNAPKSPRQNAAVVEAPKPSVASPEVKPEPKPQVQAAHPSVEGGLGTELEFLVMDDGIESPARSSAGHKMVPEDLDLLFEAPLPQPEGSTPAPERGVTVAGVPPKSPAINRSGTVPTNTPPTPTQPKHS